MGTAVLKTNLSDSIIQYIKNKIIKMSYKPGERIVESKIANELSVSHSPIREALRVLEKNRLVEHIPRKGVYVTELVEANIESLFEIMTELLVLVGKKTIKNADDKDIKNATQIVEKIIAAAKVTDTEEYYNNVIAFGIFCLSICNDKLLEEIIFEFLPSIQRILYLSFATHEDALTEGAALLMKGTKAISIRDKESTELLLRQWLAYEMANAIKGLKTGNLLK